MEFIDIFSQALVLVLVALSAFAIFKFINFFVLKLYYNQKGQDNGKTHRILKRAMLSNANFEIRTHDTMAFLEYPAILHGMYSQSLKFRVYADFPKNLINSIVEIFFFIPSIQQPKGKDFYKCKCAVLSIEKHKDISYVRTSVPVTLEFGQKRNFYRITPLPRAINTLAIWILPEEYELPRNIDDIGKPYATSKDGENFSKVRIYDISASGIGLLLDKSLDDERLQKGGEILCFIVFNEALQGAERLINFCASGKITNVRSAPDSDENKIIGIEFTSWSILKNEDKEITWFYIKRGTGISPILQWISKIENSKNI